MSDDQRPQPAAGSLRPPRTWGFRFFPTDAVAILVCGIATWQGLRLIGPMAWACPAALGHFFLFCNIFRVRRNYELCWAAAFVLNALLWQLSGSLDWLWILICQGPLTLLAIGFEMGSPRYHGIFARGVNARLDDYLAGELD